MTPLAWLRLSVTKYATRISLEYRHVPIKDVRSYLETKRSLLLEIATPGKCDLGYAPLILWEVKGGWGGDVDWASRIEDVRDKTIRWVEVLADIGQKLLEGQAQAGTDHALVS